MFKVVSRMKWQGRLITNSLLLLIFAFLSLQSIQAQVTIGLPEEPVSGALLQLKNQDEVSEGKANSNKGLLLPRVKLSDKYQLLPMFLKDIEDPLSGPSTDYVTSKTEIDAMHTGLTVYNMNEDYEKDLCLGVNLWDGEKWNCLYYPKYSYEISCNSVKVRGVYKKGETLGNSHTIELLITADNKAVGSTYYIRTDEVDGISFSGQGTITTDATGTTGQTVILKGKGTPIDYELKHLTLVANNISEQTCSATVVVVLPMQSVFAFGQFENSAGYLGQQGSGLQKMMSAAVNFGEDENSTIKIERDPARGSAFSPYTILSYEGSGATNFTVPKIAEILETKPDIVFTGYDLNWVPTASYDKQALATALKKYLDAKGVLIFICEHLSNSGIVEAFFQALYPSATISTDWTSTNPLGFNDVDDEILNGPFGDIRNKKWGNDTGGAKGVRGIPENEWIIYSRNSNGTPMIMRHKTYNLIFISEGGFNANYNGVTGSAGNGNTVSYPLAISDVEFKPITRTGWTGSTTVENARFMANALAWAIYQAQFNGINPPND